MLNHQYPKSYKLSYEYYTDYENDEIFMAYCVPYTYTKLTKFLCSLSEKIEGTSGVKDGKGILKMSKLCTTLGGL